MDDAKYVTSDVAVSEPGSLAVFGLGLLGLGYMRRRKMV
ncbi:MAG: PEP-CTERM sorting domain-containing protein [Alphaproteobacteria bacterium]